ncbi:MAG: hydantoinase/oxoprolinase family protein [Gammaproteobacteria bacterium]|nr:hydantoinase/oxoprolinase family protein [Gammaproteobacteria bacterium]
MKRVSVDIGGTFTDCLVAWDGRYVQGKSLTTHHNLSLGFFDALERACASLGVARGALLATVDSVRYATTLGTNALIERKGPRVGLLITEGFESTVPVSRGRGYAEGLSLWQAMDLSRGRRPAPIVPVALIRGVRERLDYRGEVLIPLVEDDVRRKVRELLDAGAQSFVVVSANSTVNPAHEERIREIILEEYPSSLLGALPVVLSSAVSGRRGEYVRAMSAIIDAYLHSTMYFGMSALEQGLREAGYRRPILLVHNTSGMAQMNSTDALRTVHSGPVAGIHAGDELARQTGLGNVITTDMGGTSFDIGLVVEGGIKHYDFSPTVDRWLVSLPMVHLTALGAGGGSIARCDPIFRTLKVGPDSAGSDPGPACYGRGGTQATVTDADLLLGYLDPERYANGSIPLSRRRAERVLAALGAPLGLSAIEAARLVRRRVDFDMASGLMGELRARGYRATDFTMLAYGGNGPLHCCGIARHAGIDRVLAPPYAAVFSACGASSLDQLHFHEHSQITDLYNARTGVLFEDYATFNATVAMLEARGHDDLRRQGVPPSAVRHRLELDLRYGSQTLETTIVAERRRLGSVRDVLALIERLDADYGRRYGQGSQAPESGIRIMTFRVATYVENAALRFGSLDAVAARAAPLPVAHRACFFVTCDGPLSTPCYDAAALEPGVTLEGPAIVNPGETTYLIEPGWRYAAGAQGAVWFTPVAAANSASRRAAPARRETT